MKFILKDFFYFGILIFSIIKKCHFQYDKPIIFGYKKWMLCSSSGYPYEMKFYSEKDKPSELPLGEDVVTQLLAAITDLSKHEIYFDNFFTSYDLLKKLAESRIKTTGAI